MKMRKNQKKRTRTPSKETAREGTRKPQKETASEGGRVPHRPRIKGESALHKRSAQRSRRKKEEVKARRRDGVTQKRRRKEGGGKRGRRKKKMKRNEGIRKRCRKKRRYKERKWWAKRLFSKDTEKTKVRKQGRGGGCPKLDGLVGTWFFLLIVIGQSVMGVNAASENAPKSEQMIGMQGGTEVNESSWGQTCQRRSRQEESEDRKEMQKESRMVKCTLLNGSVWNTKKKYMRRYMGTFDIFFGVEHGLKKEEMEEQFNQEAKQRWKFAADAARITDENASSENRKQSGSS